MISERISSAPCGKRYFTKLLSPAFFSIRHFKPYQRSIFYRGSDQPLRDTSNRTRCPGQYPEWRKHSEIHIGQKSVRRTGPDCLQQSDIRSRCHNCPIDSAIAQGRKPAGSCRFAHYHRHGRTFQLQQPHRGLVQRRNLRIHGSQ